MKLQHLKIWLSWVILGVCVVVMGVAYVQRWLTIRQVSCLLNGQNCPDFLQAELNKSSGLSLFADWQKIPQRVSQLLPSYQLTKATVVWPDQLMVEYATAPISYGVRGATSPVLLIDQLGVVSETPSASASAVPTAELSDELYNPLQLRLSLPSPLHSALSLLFHQQQLENTPTRVVVKNLEEIEVTVASGRSYLLSSTNAARAVAQLVFLEKALSQESLPNDAAQAKQIDLRFQYPILRTNVQ